MCNRKKLWSEWLNSELAPICEKCGTSEYRKKTWKVAQKGIGANGEDYWDNAVDTVICKNCKTEYCPDCGEQMSVDELKKENDLYKNRVKTNEACHVSSDWNYKIKENKL